MKESTSINMISKNSDIQLSVNLHHREISCNCTDERCHFTLVDEKLIESFQKLRNHWGKPIKITSAYRCQSHNKRVGGSPKSFHSKGQAVDLFVTDQDFDKFKSICELYFKFVLPYRDKKFIHCDTRGL